MKLPSGFLIGVSLIIMVSNPLHSQNLTKPNISCPAGIAVNSFTGSMFYQRTDLVIPGRGLSLDITFSYNNGETGKDYGYGRGWTFSYNMLYEMDGSNVIIRRSDGRKDVHTFNGSGYDHPAGFFDQLEEYQTGKFRMTTKYGLQYFFDDATHHRLTKIQDPNGNVITITYIGGLPATITDPSGRMLQLNWASGHLTQIGDQNASPHRTVSYQYDMLGNLSKVTDPLGNAIRYVYDERSNLTELVDRRSNVFDIAYNSAGAVVSVKSALTDQTVTYDVPGHQVIHTEEFEGGSRTTTYVFDFSGRVIHLIGNCCGYDVEYVYDADNNVTELIDANGNTTQYTYDTKGNRLTETDPLLNTVTYTYEPGHNHVASVTDKRGNTTNYTYDASGNLTQVNKPLSVTESSTYDSYGEKIRFTDGKGNVTSYSYSNQVDLTGVAYADLGTESFTYDGVGNRLASTDQRGNTTHFAYDPLNHVLTMTDPLGHSTAYNYDQNGNQVSVQDARGNTTTYAYDALDRRTRVTTPAGMTQYSYDEGGNVTGVTDPNGNVTTYQYNARNLPTGTTDALGHSSSASYDNNGNKVSQTDFNGSTTTYAYDALDRLTSLTDALTHITSHAYDANGNRTSLTDARGNTTHYQYDALNRLTQTSYPIGSVSYAYDKDDNRVSQTDANGQATTYVYDSRNQMTSTTNALGSTTSYAYDHTGNRTSVTNALSNATTYIYDALNRLTAQINPLSEASYYSYDAAGNLTSVHMPNGNTIANTYDAANRLIGVSDVVGTVSTYAYDGNSNRLTETDGNGNTTTIAYDGLNRVTSTTDPLGHAKTYAYDSNSNLLTETDRNGNATTYVYDALNRRTTSTDALGHAMTTAYDAVGNGNSITDAKGNATTYAFDAMNRLTKETFADATTRQYIYDDAGNVLTRTDNNGEVTNYTYDQVNRLTLRDYPITDDDHFTYDVLGRMTAASNANAEITYTYDAVDRVTSEVLNGKTTAYSYDIAGRKRTITYPSGRVIEEHTSVRSRLDQIKDGGSTLASWMYDAGDRPITRTYSNGVVTTYSYNANDWVSSVSHDKGATKIAQFTYAFDNEGNRLYSEKLHRATHSEKYGYDAIYQLTSDKEGTLAGGDIPSPLTQTQYNYDAVGNRTTVLRDAQTTTYAANNVNEYTSIVDGAKTIPAFDANGNLTASGSSNYLYDTENRLLHVSGGPNLACTYDPLGRRIHKESGSTIVNYYYDGARVIEERDGTDNVVATYVWGTWIDDILSMKRGGSDYFYHQNSLGSVVALTDASGVPVERYEYDSYGNTFVSDGSGNFFGEFVSMLGNPYMFTGREVEPAFPLYYFRARYYDASQGRFMQRDPIDGGSQYTYAYDNPVRWRDPLGLQSGGSDEEKPQDSNEFLKEQGSRDKRSEGGHDPDKDRRAKLGINPQPPNDHPLGRRGEQARQAAKEAEQLRKRVLETPLRECEKEDLKEFDEIVKKFEDEDPDVRDEAQQQLYEMAGNGSDHFRLSMIEKLKNLNQPSETERQSTMLRQRIEALVRFLRTPAAHSSCVCHSAQWHIILR